MNEKVERAVRAWILNTNVDFDKIAEHYYIKGAEKKRLRILAKTLRERREKEWKQKRSQ